jgi:hypothetical protein
MLRDVLNLNEPIIRAGIERDFPRMEGLDLNAGIVVSEPADPVVVLLYTQPGLIDLYFRIELNVCTAKLVSLHWAEE